MATASEQFMTLVEQRRPDIEATLGALVADDKRRFVMLAVRAIRDHKHRDGQACRCTAQSMLQCVFDAAASQLELGTGEDLAYLIPYGDELTFRPSYKGLIKRAIEAGIADHIYAELVYAKDQIQLASGDNRTVKHQFNPFDKDRGALVGSYTVVSLANGIRDFETLSLADIEAIKGAAKRTGGGKLSPAWTYFEGEMIKKSNLRRQIKRLQGGRSQSGEKAARLAAVLVLDDKDYRHIDDVPRIAAQTTLDEVADGIPAKEPPRTKEPVDPLLNEEQQVTIEAGLVTCGVRIADIPETLKRLCGVDTIPKLKVSQMAPLIETLQKEKAA